MNNLTRTERGILQMIGIGEPYGFVAKTHKITLATLYVHTRNIREKTGIKDTHDAEECRKWWRDHREQLFPIAPALVRRPLISATEDKALRLLCAGVKPRHMCSRLGLKDQTVHNALNTGRRKLGIPANLVGGERINAIRAKLGLSRPAAPQTATPPIASAHLDGDPML